MGIQTSTGIVFGITNQLPPTYDFAGYSSLTYTLVGEITNIPPFGAAYQVVTHEPLKDGVTKKEKGFVNYGSTAIDMGRDTTDSGQQKLRSACDGANKNLEHTFMLKYGDGTLRYWTGKVFSCTENGGSANNVVGSTAQIEVNRQILNIPNITLDLDFANQSYSLLGESKTFGDVVTFTRSTIATYVNSSGLITSAAINAPRLDYDPITLEPKGLLVEGQRTNLLTYSEDFTPNWALNGSPVITANSAIAPDGNLTADYFNCDNLGDGVFKSSTLTGSLNTFSCFVKSNGSQAIVKVGIDTNYAEFNTNTGTYTDSGNVTVNVESFPSGWYRVSVTHDKVGLLNHIIYGSGSQSDFLAWGAQLEEADFASSYIPTVASQVTRTADVAVNTDLATWYNQKEGSVAVEFDNGTGDGSDILSLEGASNRYTVTNPSGVNGVFYLFGVTQGVVSSGNSDVLANLAFKYNTTSLAVSVNSLTPIEGSVAKTENQSTLYIGSSSSSQIFGHISRLTYYPSALPGDQLRDLTI